MLFDTDSENLCRPRATLCYPIVNFVTASRSSLSMDL